MKKVGCISDLSFEKHAQFKNYYYALSSIFPGTIEVKTFEDIKGLDLLYIGNPYHGPNWDICKSKGFIEECNNNHTQVVIVVPEKIHHNPFYPVHLEMVKYFDGIQNLYIYPYDVEDCEIMNTKLHRVAMSKRFEGLITPRQKADKIVFIGSQYNFRKQNLTYMETFMNMKIIPTEVGRSWNEYLEVLASYKYVFCPFGDADAFVSRFYETLLVGSIPIQQVSEKTLMYYDLERDFPNCIFFTDVKKIRFQLSRFNEPKEYKNVWYEDSLYQLLKEDNLL